MFEYDYYGELKQTMVMCQLKYDNYKMNILYEDYEGNTKCVISTNMYNIIEIDYDIDYGHYDFNENEDVKKIKDIFIEQLKEHFTKQNMEYMNEVPEYVQEYLLNKVREYKL